MNPEIVSRLFSALGVILLLTLAFLFDERRQVEGARNLPSRIALRGVFVLLAVTCAGRTVGLYAEQVMQAIARILLWLLVVALAWDAGAHARERQFRPPSDSSD